MTIAFTFILGLFTGGFIVAVFAAGAAWHEHLLFRTITPPNHEDYVPQASLLDRHTDVGRFAEHGGLCGPGAHIVSDELTGAQQERMRRGPHEADPQEPAVSSRMPAAAMLIKE
jgi:hypothetical protein